MRWPALLPTVAAAALGACLGSPSPLPEPASSTHPLCARERADSNLQLACGIAESTAPACALAGCSEEDLASIEAYLGCVEQLPDCGAGDPAALHHQMSCQEGSCGLPPNTTGLYACEKALRLRPDCAFEPRATSGLFD